MADAVLTRRTMLRAIPPIGAIGATMALPVVANAATEADENPALIEAWKQFRWAENDYRDAVDLDAKALADKALNSAFRNLIIKKQTTMYGVRLKSDAIASSYESMGIVPANARNFGIVGYSYWLACDVLEMTDHLNRRGAV